MVQLRSIEKKILRVARERNIGSLADTKLPFLLDLTCAAIFTHLENLVAARAVNHTSRHLRTLSTHSIVTYGVSDSA